MSANPPPPAGELPAVHEAWLPREHSLHRPRHGRRQLTALICALVFFTTPAILWVFGVRAGEIENHKLASFPSLADGWGVFTDLPAWATDHLVFRGAAIQAADDISQFFFGERAPLDQNSSPTGPLPGTAGQPDQQDTDGDAEPPLTSNQRVIVGKDEWLFFGNDIEAKCSPARPLAESIAQLNKLRGAVTESGREFVLAVSPDKSTMVSDQLPDSFTGQDCAEKVTHELWPAAVNEAGSLDLRPALNREAERLNRPVYFKQDSHWSDEGSLQLTRTLAETIEPKSTETWRTPRSGYRTTTADLTVMLGRPEERTGATYELRTEGLMDRSTNGAGDLRQPVHRKSTPGIGTVDKQTSIIGDSFTVVSSRYLQGAFTDLTLMHYNSITDQPRRVVDEFAKSEVVVVQIVERSLAAGNAPILDDGFINRTRETLAAQPIR
ncbi:acetyltransferase AlgX (SGNH hydrolase-like protein) [Tamaricihabitans halophyticus]|uniref:Acetyltransferase AlgX (SGNH hydrolase-like protein) n=1 Tax=Tamaricihabitans halophyticus TaxID=1262583 RepID=A0A4R2RB98_9PSEU|nr:hypothetical protein [Tamaricihabitans halophyticus]TCP56695.1 acetyltransferase AlgX (SGNH hydrolase-like protein) [Tamaricihabitans halophyticus]